MSDSIQRIWFSFFFVQNIDEGPGPRSLISKVGCQ